MHLFTPVTRFVTLVVSALIASQATAFANPPTAEDFMVQYSSIKLSPDGRFVSVLQPHGVRNALVIYDFENPPGEGGQPINAIPSGPNVNLSSYRWLNHERLYIVAGRTFERENFRYSFQEPDEYDRTMAIVVNYDGGVPRIMLNRDFGWIGSMLPDDPDYIVARQGVQAFRRNIYTLESEDIVTGRRDSYFVQTDATGNIRTSIDYGSANRDRIKVFWRASASARWQNVLDREFEGDDFISPMPLLGNASELYFYSNFEGLDGVYRIRPNEGGEFERVFLHAELDVTGFTRDRVSGDPLYATVTGNYVERHYFDADFEALDLKVDADLEGGYARIVSSTRDGQRHLILMTRVGQPSSYYLLDSSTDTYRFFGGTRPGVHNADLAQTKILSYSARDGLEIPAYLTTPAGLGEGPQPLIVMPHGGPFARDSLGFDYLRQFLATRGYLVFQPQFRGSTGFGRDLYSAGEGEFGLKMQDDVTDGVQFLIDQGIADPDQICIVGWSYGDYAALNGAVTTPRLYECAVGINGVYNVPEYRRPTSLAFTDVNSDNADWEHHFGERANDRRSLREISPRHNAGQISIPVLLIASAEDTTVRIAHSEDMSEAMNDSGVAHETLFFEDGNHGMNSGPSLIATMEAIEDFLDRHLD